MSGDHKPLFFLIGGANGSGKSTLYNIYSSQSPEFASLEFLNVDIYQAQHNVDNKTAAEYVRKRTVDNIRTGKSFILESVMSHESKVGYLDMANKKGYETTLLFIGTSSPGINVKRVKERVSQGGHDVPEDKTLSRWETLMSTRMYEAAKTAQVTHFYDTSAKEAAHRKIAEMRDHKGLKLMILRNHARPLPKWFDLKQFQKKIPGLRVLERSQNLEVQKGGKDIER